MHSIERFPPSGACPYFKLRPILCRKEEIAAQFPGRWIINQDSDEIRCSPWLGVSLSEGIGRVDDAGFNAIDFDVLSFRPVDGLFRPGDNPETHFRYFERGNSLIGQVQAWRQPKQRVTLKRHRRS